MAAEVHKGDVGTVFKAYLEDDGVELDVSGATILQLWFKSPSDVVKQTATLITSGTDGGIQYTTATSSDLHSVGNWRLQGYAELGGGAWHSETFAFHVYKNLDD